MANKDLADVFADTKKLYETNEVLKKTCEESRKNHKVYKESCAFTSPKNRFENEAQIIVSKKRSFEAAEPYAKNGGKISVLNFANSVHQGGGVVWGARAQEECLCRCSTLYDSLISAEMERDFYGPHRKPNPTSEDFLANDDVIFTPGVKVFKTDTDFPELRPENEWFDVDVLTCAAPCLSWGTGSASNEELKEIHKSRARQILNVALENKSDVVILGAFGCGAFHNPPEIVASAIKEVLPEFKNAFKTIEFAVYSSSRDASNYEVFNKTFC